MNNYQTYFLFIHKFLNMFTNELKYRILSVTRILVVVRQNSLTREIPWSDPEFQCAALQKKKLFSDHRISNNTELDGFSREIGRNIFKKFQIFTHVLKNTIPYYLFTKNFNHKFTLEINFYLYFSILCNTS